MSKHLWIVILGFLSATGYADVFVGIEYEVNISTLESTKQFIERAGQRPSERQAYALYEEVQDNIMLNCPAYKPDRSGMGCNLFFLPKTRAQREEIAFSIRKPVDQLLLKSAVESAFQKTQAIDPNTTEEHLQFGNPLYKLPAGMSDGTHYYCKPEGEVGKRKWACYLSVSESLKS